VPLLPGPHVAPMLPVSNQGTSSRNGMRRWPAILLMLLAGGIPAYVLATRLPSAGAPVATRTAPAIPVIAAEVRRADVPIFLSGLGTVQALNSVLVKSRVDGQIKKINFTEGQDVHRGDVLVEIDPEPYQAALNQAQASKLRDEAQLENARLDLNRFSRLAATGAVASQQLDTTRALVKQLEASIQSDQATIYSAQIQLDYSRIRSPLDGRAGTRLIDAGNMVKATDTGGIVIINQLDPIFVTFPLPADTLPTIRAAAAKGDIKVSAEDSAGATLASGKLSVIDNLINPNTATINFKAIFENASHVLWPGQFVNVRVEIDVRHDVVAVPITVVQQGPSGPYAFVVGKDRVVQKRMIKVGVTNKTTAVVDSGLDPGETAVTDGQYRIQAGSRVDLVGDRDSAPPEKSAGGF
jgi:membrane fusion protein, multidrug efflux system